MNDQFLFLKKHFFVISFCCFTSTVAFTQTVQIKVNAAVNKKKISPYIYGKNDFLDHPDQFYKDAGLRFARINGGNNASAYNWQEKLAVHPDWYNNVYAADWSASAQKINANFPDMQGMFAFQLLGRVASNSNNNFNDWGYNQAQYWSGVGQNLAGGGTPNTSGGSKALVDGNPELFSKPWPADSSVGILTDWFGTNGKGFNKDKFVYWNMDNEVDIWNGTHDWAMPTLLSASDFMDRYIELAKKSKAIYPGIKLCGPVTTSEWQWYQWSDEKIYVNGRYYPWIEYFIKRLGDEYKATGVKLVDVLDIHNYPSYNNNDAAALQGHRIYYDTSYDYPGSNGIKTSTGGWDDSLKEQYIFKRIDGWLTEHFGANHGITAGLSEWGTMSSSNPSLESVIYASHLGTFANNGVELFSPWNWSIGMWETLHLFSRYAKEYSVSSTSSLENTVSAYTSVNQSGDAMTVMIVNKDMNASRTITVNLSGFSVANGNSETLQIAALPTTETFVSHTNNALKKSTVSVNSSTFTITVPALSTTAVLLKTATTLSVDDVNTLPVSETVMLYPNPANDKLQIKFNLTITEPTQLTVYNMAGQKLKVMNVNSDPEVIQVLDVSKFSVGSYFLLVKNSRYKRSIPFIISR
ncbi:MULTISPECIES: glycoside hydrolase family 44 protein [Flavobacterium]|uniref:glycoside hydrolase family 44 protein n=1 Tax=Flavobacterium TaxID=237 RepID=UPI002114CB5F|nr:MULTISPECIES: glycoside hydrolase family 44 protein [Flavobacterium]UUF12506.1 T9SS type A sorting domain-containing protein [Flavobacterium panici]